MTSVVLLGPPGVGKGTQAGMLRREFGFQVVSSGVLLRREVARRTELGATVASFMQRGVLAPEELVDSAVFAEVGRCDGMPLVVEGFPKTVEQADRLAAALRSRGRRVDLAIALHADPRTLRARLVQRSRAEGRADDTSATVDARLEAFGVTPTDLLTFYRSQGVLRIVDADRPLTTVNSEVRRLVLALGVEPLP